MQEVLKIPLPRGKKSLKKLKKIKEHDDHSYIKSSVIPDEFLLNQSINHEVKTTSINYEKPQKILRQTKLTELFSRVPKKLILNQSKLHY